METGRNSKLQVMKKKKNVHAYFGRRFLRTNLKNAEEQYFSGSAD